MSDCFEWSDPVSGFEAWVRYGVMFHAPVDALEFSGACRAAADAIMNGIIADHNHAANGCPRPDPDGRGWRRWDRSGAIRRIADGTIAMRLGDVGLLGVVIAKECFAMVRNRDYIDTDEIPFLIGTALGVALEIERRDSTLAETLVCGPFR